MRKIILILMLVGVSTYWAQAQENEKKEVDVYEEVEQMPEYPGGQDSMKSFVAKNVKYPPKAIKNEIQGKVFVGFIIDESGNVTNAKIIRSVDIDLDKEALRVVNMMEKWTPGKEKGKIVKVKYTLPISFALK